MNVWTNYQNKLVRENKKSDNNNKTNNIIKTAKKQQKKKPRKKQQWLKNQKSIVHRPDMTTQSKIFKHFFFF